ncbi:MAG: PAS domain-containing sensor histidine kinase [Proteobacteria bacterium]|nr:PAS domain-containing sensor histidine kinase [Pseudomonadota bacterium]
MTTHEHLIPVGPARILGWARRVELVRRLALALVLAAVFSGVLTYAALSGSSPFGPDPQTVLMLLLVDLVLLLSLGGVVSRRLVLLWIERRRGSAGSRLHTRMVVLFSLVAVAPAIVVAVFSALFFNFGLESWFNERVRTALEESVAVAEAYREEHRQQIRAEVLAMANELDRRAAEVRSDPLKLRSLLVSEAASLSLPEAIVFNRNGDILARAGLSFSMEFDLVSARELERAAQGEVVVVTTDNVERVRALVRLDRFVDTYLFVGRYVDSRVLIHADQTKSAVAEYQRLESEREGLQITFSLIFIVVALLLLLAAVWIALLFASRLVGPVSSLVRAAERVREGDLSARVPEGPVGDEIGSLSRAFNRMTSQLQGQRTELMTANEQLDNRRRFTEAVLSGVSSGVIGVAADGTVNLPNRAAANLLETTAAQMTGARLTSVLPELAALFAEAQGRPARLATGQVQVTRKGNMHTLLVRIAAERSEEGVEGYVVTFDDVTQLMAAQRSAAWADIARRIAHEIKNPLTPIQLSAERLRRKYRDDVASDPEVFEQCTETIIRQVGDIGRLIDEFSSFARMPAPVFRNENVVELAKQALFLQQVANPGIDYETQLPADPVVLRCDPRQMSQVLTNLLLNSAQAIAARSTADGQPLPKGFILLRVERTEDEVILTVSDNGRGLPDADRNRLMEPYVTTKVKGTGLGLAIVAKVIDDHRGTITLADRSGGGATVVLRFPVGEVEAAPERPKPQKAEKVRAYGA